MHMSCMHQPGRIMWVPQSKASVAFGRQSSGSTASGQLVVTPGRPMPTKEQWESEALHQHLKLKVLALAVSETARAVGTGQSDYRLLRFCLSV